MKTPKKYISYILTTCLITLVLYQFYQIHKLSDLKAKYESKTDVVFLHFIDNYQSEILPFAEMLEKISKVDDEENPEEAVKLIKEVSFLRNSWAESTQQLIHAADVEDGLNTQINDFMMSTEDQSSLWREASGIITGLMNVSIINLQNYEKGIPMNFETRDMFFQIAQELRILNEMIQDIRQQELNNVDYPFRTNESMKPIKVKTINSLEQHLININQIVESYIHEVYKQ